MPVAARRPLSRVSGLTAWTRCPGRGPVRSFTCWGPTRQVMERPLAAAGRPGNKATCCDVQVVMRGVYEEPSSATCARISNCAPTRSVPFLSLPSHLSYAVATLLALCASSHLISAQSLVGLADAGHWKRVRAAAEARLRTDARDAEALWLMAGVRDAFGDHEGGTTSHGVARWRLAQMFGGQGRLAEVLRELETARRLEPKREEIARDLERLRKTH